ncbi:MULTISPECIES: hypothetical protein [Cupriavidus]|uniref:DUF4148 domain-containing protein n=1 Tax=Cupriavidus pauculus TaxID=82633 RepID=A0A5P2H5R3_9BURK|nr:hypothetical protein [Cupriavidus pauculus]QET02974.1 hypothetical protein FOB72_13555 [Cupriavidus pauculus]
MRRTTRFVRAFGCAFACTMGGAAALCMAAPASAMDVHRAEGVEIINGRPPQPAAPATARPARGTPGAPVQPATFAPATKASVEAAAATVPQRLRAAQGVLEAQISEYNRALLENAPPESLGPLEAAIGQTLEQIDTLVRTPRAREP